MPCTKTPGTATLSGGCKALIRSIHSPPGALPVARMNCPYTSMSESRLTDLAGCTTDILHTKEGLQPCHACHRLHFTISMLEGSQTAEIWSMCSASTAAQMLEACWRLGLGCKLQARVTSNSPARLPCSSAAQLECSFGKAHGHYSAKFHQRHR